MMSVTSEPTFMSPERLAARIAARERLTILDVRENATWTIKAPSVIAMHVPSAATSDDLAALAGELDGTVVVLCNRGKTAQGVATALQRLGVDAAALQGGMRAWIALLRAYPVGLGVPGLAVVQVQRPGRGCLSYVLEAGGRMLVVDPAPDADYYAGLAEQLGGKVTDVMDTHLHADHVSGARALAERTGATLRLPAASIERGVTFELTPLRDGDQIDLGGVSIRAIALPGHTSDMTGLLVAGRALISGDSLFAEGIARPDLQRTDPDGARAMARMLHSTLHERVLSLGDDVLLLPGHDHPGVHGAAVAPRLGDVRERVPELRFGTPEAFAEAILADMPPRPANYQTIIAVNAGAHPFDPELETGGNSCATR